MRTKKEFLSKHIVSISNESKTYYKDQQKSVYTTDLRLLGPSNKLSNKSNNIKLEKQRQIQKAQ